METKEICSKIKDQVPNECDDSVPCVHRGRFYGGPEWEHQVRNAQQILKRKRKIHLEGKKWSCFERQV